MSKPEYLTPMPEFGVEHREQWPPQIGHCPDCNSYTIYAGESYGRCLYRCEETECKRCERGAWQDTNALIYARFPNLWANLDFAFQLSRDFPNILTPLIFLCENAKLLPVIGRCSCCMKLFSGLYSPEATAGFVFETTEDKNWQEHSNDPTFSTRLICDKCLRTKGGVK